MSAWGRQVLALSSAGAGNKETQQQFPCFRICILTSLCPYNEQRRFFYFYFFMCLGKGYMIQMTTDKVEQKVVKSCIAGKSFRKCHMPFWDKLLSDTILKYGSIWLSGFFNYFFCPLSTPFVAASLTPHLHHTVPGMYFPDVVNHFFLTVSRCRGWREERGKRGEEARSDLTRLGDVFSTTRWQQDIPSHPLCSTASSCLLCSSTEWDFLHPFFPPFYLHFEHC